MKWSQTTLIVSIYACIAIYYCLCLFALSSFFVSPDTAFGHIAWKWSQGIYFDNHFSEIGSVVGFSFIAMTIVLHAFLINKLIAARNVLAKILAKKKHYSAYFKEFKHIGSGFIFFASLKYLLIMGTGFFFVSDYNVNISYLPVFLSYSILGAGILFSIFKIKATKEINFAEGKVSA